MKKIWLLLVMLVFYEVYGQQAGSISGTVMGSSGEGVLAGATVAVKGLELSTLTDIKGRFEITGLAAGAHKLLISHVGYEPLELSVNVVANHAHSLSAILNHDERLVSEVVITASRRPEKITNAPASIQVLTIRDFDRFAGSNVNEMIATVQGVKYTRSGIEGITFNARGFNSAFNNKTLQLVDGRISMAALSGSLPIFNNGTYMKSDLERIEIVLGPQTALYGPNAHNAVFNVITKDPRKYPGTIASLSAGNHNQFSSRLRHAEVINSRWAFKLSGEYSVSEDYKFIDSVYAGGGPFGPPVAIPERNVDRGLRHIRGEVGVYYSFNPVTDLVISGGGSNNNFLQVTTGGRNQMRDLTYGFLQARLVNPRFYVTVYNTWGNIGSSYPIHMYTRDFWNRTTGGFPRMSPDSAEALARGARFREASERLNAEAQYNREFKKYGLFLVAGLNFQNERPNGFGLNLVDSFHRIRINQYGAVVQLEKTLAKHWRLIGAGRVDHHNNFGSFFAPKFTLARSLGEGSVRLSWAKAYSMPSIQNQYAGINRTLFGNGGEGIEYIPNNTRIDEISTRKRTPALKPEEINTWEIGYKGFLTEKLFLDINYYNGESKNFISPALSTGGRVLTVNGIAVTHNRNLAGNVFNDTLSGASFLTFFNYGRVRAYGIDAGLRYTFNSWFSMSLKYSWFDSDITKGHPGNDANKDDIVSPEEKSLNAPNHRGIVGLYVQNLCKRKLSLQLHSRLVERYDFYSGSLVGTSSGRHSRTAPKNYNWGPLGGFVSFDLSGTYLFNSMISANLGVTNIFNTRQIEFVSSPSIGRLIMAEVKINLPGGKKSDSK